MGAVHPYVSPTNGALLLLKRETLFVILKYLLRRMKHDII